MTTEERKEYHEERSLNIKHRSPLLNLLGLWLTHAGDQVDIPLAKLIVHMSPMEVASAENEFQKNCIMEAMADYILDGLAPIIGSDDGDDEGILNDKQIAYLRETGLSDKQIEKLRKDYELWKGMAIKCGVTSISSTIEKSGSYQKISWDAKIRTSPDDKHERDGGRIETTEETAQLGLQALKENAYATTNCNARHVLSGVRRMAFRAGVVSLTDNLSCDKRSVRQEEF